MIYAVIGAVIGLVIWASGHSIRNKTLENFGRVFAGICIVILGILIIIGG